MSPVEQGPEETQDSVQELEPEWLRRKRMADVFGDVLPDQTSDDRAPASGPDSQGDGKGDDWYRDQVPPHHG